VSSFYATQRGNMNKIRIVLHLAVGFVIMSGWMPRPMAAQNNDGALAQSVQVPSAIKEAITDSNRLPSTNSRHPLSSAERDAGRMQFGTQLHRISLFFKGTSAQEGDLKSLISDQPGTLFTYAGQCNPAWDPDYFAHFPGCYDAIQSGDYGSAESADLTTSLSIAVDGTGNVFVVDDNGSPVTVPEPPAFDIATGTYATAQFLTLSDVTPGVKLFYTMDGTEPTASSTQYAGPITISSSRTVKAIAVGNNIVQSSVATAVYSLTVPNQVVPAVTVTPSFSSITTAQALSVSVTVSGGNDRPAPTGTVTLASGSYTSTVTTLDGGSSTINIPAGSLATGLDTLTVSYSGDGDYSATEGTGIVSVATAVNFNFIVTGTAVSVIPGRATANTSTVTVTPVGGFTGSVVLSAAIASSPTGAQYPPSLSFGSTSPVEIGGSSAGTATLTISTTAATSAALADSKRPGFPWYAAGGATLVSILPFVMPARRRRWQTMLALLVALSGGTLACGVVQTRNQATTAGTYTVTITGTSGSLTSAGVITVTVQ
jgi:hypothetical protein